MKKLVLIMLMCFIAVAFVAFRSQAFSNQLMQNLVDSCHSGDVRYACVWIGETTSSTCKKMDQCAESMANALRENNIVFTTNDNRAPYADKVVAYKPGCIGYRSDLGGTKEGATALAILLGRDQFYVDDSSCKMAGFKYNVIRP